MMILVDTVQEKECTERVDGTRDFHDTFSNLRYIGNVLSCLFPHQPALMSVQYQLFLFWSQASQHP
jgi:hypothetical protein